MWQRFATNAERLSRQVMCAVRWELDWEPTIGLEEGLERTIEYFRVNLGIY